MSSKREGQTFIERQERLADNADARAKWLGGLAFAFHFWVAQGVIIGIYAVFGWTLPQMTTLEIIVFAWVGPAGLLWWAANSQQKDADSRRALVRKWREEERKERLAAASKPVRQKPVKVQPTPEPKAPSAIEVRQQAIRDQLKIKN